MDYWRGTLAPRRLAVLVEHLPRDSATKRALLDDAADWGLAEHLLALIVDHLAGANWQRAGDAKAQRPEPLPRPGIKKPDGKRYGGNTRRDPNDVRAALARHYERKE